ncbi:biotin carboxylase N-terminal domain-containing protein [Microtetraspora sp. NBRC 16547]|uniref:acetyl/propionyl/methylcrotonyl-CoA carboxylase subunit alpha n=1 Tax=Microtetraspora sp. NBRC 16547 TaxID=3030993 RepID=UPI0024A0A7FE|nr:biotin carboxylase N-terminal domain-containing protein [Microtetraspora sp. NBRC 16547]GLW96879.1 putative acyl-CoA carboxylase alpha subunit AccA [Microtetraspora sp. NBRC 16547]
MFGSVLIANRGEIAVRIIRTLRAMGVRPVAVHSDADRAARHVREADLAVRLPGGYLDVEGVIAAALQTGAEAVHPGYGFLAESAAFARRCAEAGLVFIGPPPTAIEAMGDKIRAKATVAAAGVPVVPGGAEPADDLAEAAHAIGFPVLIKPSAGGGGKGMVLVRSAAELPEAIASARRTALAAFGDGTLLVERFVANPRHIEIQIMADAHGNVVHLGERECSLQRRHQKIIEEAPSPLLDPVTRARMGAAAVDAARAVGYVGAGTVEFIVQGTESGSGPGDTGLPNTGLPNTGPANAGPGEAGPPYHFMEMNTRLQVEHPVTEMVTGLDLVELQVRVAAGELLPFGQEDVRLDGHAVEARVYAEDPARGFLPSGGRVLALREPREGRAVRVDSGLAEGMVVGGDYDPMLSKVVAWAPDRPGALRALDHALASTAILGVTTNIGFLRGLVARPEVVAGRLDTGLVERLLQDEGPEGCLAAEPLPLDALVAAALVFRSGQGSGLGAGDPWDVPDGWRIGERAWTGYRLESRGAVVDVRVRGLADDAEAEVSGHSLRAALTRPAEGEIAIDLDGVTRRYVTAWDGTGRDGGVLWLGRDGMAWPIVRHELGDPGDRTRGAGGADGVVRSPMPGTVLVVKAAAGDRVRAGQPLVVVEAMKMEHSVPAPVDGVVTELSVRIGQAVELDGVLARVEPDGSTP